VQLPSYSPRAHQPTIKGLDHPLKTSDGGVAVTNLLIPADLRLVHSGASSQLTLADSTAYPKLYERPPEPLKVDERIRETAPVLQCAEFFGQPLERRQIGVAASEQLADLAGVETTV